MSSHANLLRDVGFEIRQQALAATREARRARGDDFLRGQALALHGVVSLMQQQALAFGVPLSDLALDGLDADHELL